MCRELDRCFDSDTNVRGCAERCEDRVDDNALADKLDACTGSAVRLRANAVGVFETPH
jgi:hypothetical protein